MLPAVLTAAIVLEDQVFLRVAPEEDAPHPVLLYRGDWLEVRGEVRGYLQVYDHRHERSGYVAASRVRSHVLQPQESARLRGALELLEHLPEQESLGIGYAALYSRAAPPEGLDAAFLRALGVLSDRLARRASARRRPGDQLPEHLAVAASYGVEITTVDVEGASVACYDGEAFRRLLALGGTEPDRAIAALALTDPRCRPRAAPAKELELARWDTEVLGAVEVTRVPSPDRERLHLRRAHAWARLSHELARRAQSGVASGTGPSAGVSDPAEAAERAVSELARVDREALGARDTARYEEVAVWVSTVRFAGLGFPGSAAGKARLERRPTGETCVVLGGDEVPPVERCTYGVIWEGSLRTSPRGDLRIVAAAPIRGWVELWLFSWTGTEWTSQTLVPGAVEPELGYVEHAGWTPDGGLLVVKEVKRGGAIEREFQLLQAAGAVVEKTARTASGLAAFRRHASPEWRRGTLALR